MRTATARDSLKDNALSLRQFRRIVKNKYVISNAREDKGFAVRAEEKKKPSCGFL